MKVRMRSNSLHPSAAAARSLQISSASLIWRRRATSGAQGDEERMTLLCGDGLAHVGEGGDAGLGLVESAVLDTGGGDPLAGFGERRFDGNDDLGSHCLGIGLGDVSAIGEEYGASGLARSLGRGAGKHQRRAGAGKTAQPAHIGEVGDQQGIYTCGTRRIGCSLLA